MPDTYETTTWRAWLWVRHSSINGPSELVGAVPSNTVGLILWGCGGGCHDSRVVKVPHRLRFLTTNQKSFLSIFPVFLFLTQIHRQQKNGTTFWRPDKERSQVWLSPLKCLSMEVCVPIVGVVLRGETRLTDKVVSTPFHAVPTMTLRHNGFERLVKLRRVVILLHLTWGHL